MSNTPLSLPAIGLLFLANFLVQGLIAWCFITVADAIQERRLLIALPTEWLSSRLTPLRHRWMGSCWFTRHHICGVNVYVFRQLQFVRAKLPHNRLRVEQRRKS